MSLLAGLSGGGGGGVMWMGQMLVNLFFMVEVFWLLLKRHKGAIAESYHSRQILSSLPLPVLGKGGWKRLWCWNSGGFWRKWIIWPLFSQISGQDMGLDWLHSWMNSGGSWMEMVYSFLLFLACQWLSAQLTIVCFGADLQTWGAVAQFLFYFTFF